LSRAASRQYLPTIEYLLSKGAKIRPGDLRLATHWQSPELVARLIAAGGDVNAAGGLYGVTPLIYAASSDGSDLATLKLLLDKGANPNAADLDGEKPLDWAVRRQDRAKIELLTSHGATEAKTERYKTYPAPDGIADARTSLTRSVGLLLP